MHTNKHDHHHRHHHHRSTKKISKKTVVVCIAIMVVILAGLYVASLLESNYIDNSISQYNEEDIIYFNDEKYVPKSNLRTILIAGIDNTGKVEKQEYNNAGQCDFIALLIIDRNNKNYKILHINRDAMTNVPVLGITGEKTDTIYAQIALAHAYGDGMQSSCKNTVDAVSEYLYGIKIDGYMVFNIDAVGIINDAVGGVEVTLEDDFTNYDPEMKKGETLKLNGNQAIIYSRFRKDVGDSSNVNRMSRQRQFIESLTLSAKNVMKSNNELALSLFDSLEEYMLSSFNKSQFGGLADKVYSYSNDGYFTINGENVKGEEFMEFYSDENDLKAKVIEIFYKKA